MTALRGQRGVALLSAMLVVALAVVLVAALLDVGEASRARSRNALRAEQTWQLLHGLEGWAGAALRRDSDDGSGIDGPEDPWLQPLPPVQIPGGRIQGRLRDRSGCFDLNALHRNGADDEQAIARFERLLTALRLDPTIAAQVADWLDADLSPRSGGAEDGQYLRRTPPYRSAGRPFAHVSELRLLATVDDKVYQRLAPHVCAQPQVTPLNLNFASPAIWMSLDGRISEAAAQRLWREGRARYRDVEEVRSALREEGVEAVELSAYGTASRYVLMEAEIEVDGVPYVYASLLERAPGGVRVLARTRGRL
ncbi:MAG: type II secretion system minor pseudopilin GspK [Lysobacteraceae bacterium]|jgi:general secretion pathway protein K